MALPLIAIVTPATLTVQVSSQPNITILDAPIPIPDYDTMENFGTWTGISGGGHLIPSTYVSRVLLSVASLGSILTLPAPFPNSSYALNFYGPSISCDTPNNASFIKHVGEVIENSTWVADPYAYVGFVPTWGRGSTERGVDEEYALRGLDYALNDSLVATAASLDQTAANTSAAKFYVAVPDGLPNRANKSIECQLYNSSIALNFTFNNGQQSIRYKSKKLNPVATFDTVSCYKRDRKYCKAVHAYTSLVGAMGQFLLGSLTKSHYGSLSSTQTQIRSSVLMDTKEMQVLSADTPESMIGNISMSDALEELFTNITISLFSNSKFLQNNTVASRGQVAYLSAQNAFSYDPRNLFIAYGVGVLLATLIVIIGLLCIKSASASYGNSFSTILRTTRNPGLDNIVPAAETSGAEPLSRQLSNVRLVLRRQGGTSEGSDDEKATFFAVDSIPADLEREQRHRHVETFLQHNKGKGYSGETVDISSTENRSPWERNRGRNLERAQLRD